MRQIPSHIHPEYDSGLRITVEDEPGPGGANHEYRIYTEEPAPDTGVDVHVRFQKGPVSEVGHNGILEGALVAIMIDRYRAFQNGPFPSDEGDRILDHLRQVESLIHKRVTDRVRRGVMSTNQK